MAEPAANVIHTKDPGEIVIGPSHASYAFSVLSERTTGAASAFIEFEDAMFPEGYAIYIEWSKPTVLGGGNAGQATYPPSQFALTPGRQCRGFGIAFATRLSSAIRGAVIKSNAATNPIGVNEISDLTCTIGLLQRFRPLDLDSTEWQQGTHGLALKMPNADFGAQGMDYQPETWYVIPKEVPEALNWSFDKSLVELFKMAGVSGVTDPSTYVYGTILPYTLWIFDSCRVQVSKHQSISFVNGPGSGNVLFEILVPNPNDIEVKQASSAYLQATYLNQRKLSDVQSGAHHELYLS